MNKEESIGSLYPSQIDFGHGQLVRFDPANVVKYVESLISSEWLLCWFLILQQQSSLSKYIIQLNN